MPREEELSLRLARSRGRYGEGWTWHQVTYESETESLVRSCLPNFFQRKDRVGSAVRVQMSQGGHNVPISRIREFCW